MTGKSRRDLYAEQTRAAVVAAATARFAEPLAHPGMIAMIRDACRRLGYQQV